MRSCGFLIGSPGNIGAPAAQSIITRSVPPDEQSAVQGALTSIAGIVGPLLWTWIFGASFKPGQSPALSGLAFYGAGVTTLLGLWLAWRALRLRDADGV